MARGRRSIVWSPEAESDLFEIRSWYAVKASADVADARLRAIDRACRRLQDFPRRGRARGELLPGLRSLLINPHVVFYRITPNSIEIVRVLHSRRDIGAIFSNPEDR